MEWSDNKFLVSTNKDLLRIDKIHEFLSKSAYWCLGIPKNIVEKAINESLCFGLYDLPKKNQIGFARVVTDKATFAWLCDIYVEENYRAQGLASWLMKCVLRHPELQHLRRICLSTKDAHSLYKRFGFKVTATPENWMEIKDNDLYKKMQAELEFEKDAEQLLESAIESNLKMTYENRIEAHENARQLAEDLRLAGENLHAKSKGTTKNPT